MKTLALFLVTCVLLAQGGASDDVPEMCRWTDSDCQRLPNHPSFHDNCDTTNPIQGSIEYSCWEKCQDPGRQCKYDYCTGYRSKCQQSTSPQTVQITTLARQAPTQSTSTPNATKSRTPTPNTDHDRLTTKNAERNSPKVESTSRKFLPTSSPTAVKNDASSSTNSNVFIQVNINGSLAIYVVVLLTFIALYVLVKLIYKCCRRCHLGDPPDSNAENIGIIAKVIRKLFKSKRGNDDYKCVKYTTGNGKEDEEASIQMAEKSDEVSSPLLQPSEPQRATDEGGFDRPLVEQLSRQMRSLIKLLQNLATGNTESKGRQRQQSTSVFTSGDSTGNDQKTPQKVGSMTVYKSDLDTLDTGRLTDNMVTALVRLCKHLIGYVGYNVRVVSFHESFPDNFADLDVVLWLRHNNTKPEEETTHFYLAIVEVKAKVIHVCDSLTNLEMSAEKRSVKEKPALTGFRVTNATLEAEKQRDTISCGLYTIMFVEQYLKALRDGLYAPGQETKYQLRFLTANGTADVDEYRAQLRALRAKDTPDQ